MYLFSKETKKPEENIVVSKIHGKFGMKKFDIEAKVYNTEEDKIKYEVLTKKHKKKLAEEVKKAEEEAKKAKAATKESSKETESEVAE